jgi:hypothetical protein
VVLVVRLRLPPLRLVWLLVVRALWERLRLVSSAAAVLVALVQLRVLVVLAAMPQPVAAEAAAQVR